MSVVMKCNSRCELNYICSMDHHENWLFSESCELKFRQCPLECNDKIIDINISPLEHLFFQKCTEYKGEKTFRLEMNMWVPIINTVKELDHS